VDSDWEQEKSEATSREMLAAGAAEFQPFNVNTLLGSILNRCII
jgi:hypothetical protein